MKDNIKAENVTKFMDTVEVPIVFSKNQKHSKRLYYKPLVGKYYIEYDERIVATLSVIETAVAVYNRIDV